MNSKGNTLVLVVIILALVLGGTLLYVNRYSSKNNKQSASQTQKSEEYNPAINPVDFSTKITNKYFTLPVGKKFVYESATKGGPEKVEIKIGPETKNIMGVTTLLYHDQVFLNGQMHEDTKDWLAQDKAGNVWYFGEEVDNYDKGKFKDHAGSFIAGVDGAKPGIWIKAEQKVGDSYRQEYYKGKAEDKRDVLAVDQTVTTKLATYKGCVKVYDYTPLDSASKENKYYCPQVGGEVLTEDVTANTRLELTSVVNP